MGWITHSEQLRECSVKWVLGPILPDLSSHPKLGKGEFSVQTYLKGNASILQPCNWLRIGALLVRPRQSTVVFATDA